jgi:hypothetical protein
VAFVKQLAIGPVQTVQPELDCPAEKHAVSSRSLDRVENVLPFGFRVPALKDPTREVPSQPDSRGQDQMT